MKTLIIYYSRTGITKKLAEILQEKLSADIEVITDTVNRKGPIGYLKSGKEAMTSFCPEILPLNKPIGDYDLVLIGTPNWAANMASPIRSFISQSKEQIKQAAFFCTQDGSGAERAFTKMEEALGKKSKANLVLSTKEVTTNQGQEKIEAFIKTIKN